MKSLRDRFLVKAQASRDTGCWIWIGSLTRGGYGQIRVKKDGRWTMARAHRISWELYNGRIPKNSQVLHICDNPICVNPSHLFLGTTQDNTLDKMKKGRHGWGIHAKINPQIARQIRQATGTNQEIARTFDISPTEVSYIKHFRRWKESAGGLEN